MTNIAIGQPRRRRFSSIASFFADLCRHVLKLGRRADRDASSTTKPDAPKSRVASKGNSVPARPPRLVDIGQSTVAHITLAKSLFQRGRHKQALEMLETALRENPELADVHLIKGLIHAQRAEYETASDSLELATRLDANSQQAWLALSYVRFELEHLQPALEAIDRSLKIDDESANAHLLRGNILSAMDRRPEAISSYRRALLANPQLAIARNKLAYLLAETGDVDEAISQSFIALRLNPTNANTRITLGNLNRKLGKLDDAIVEYREAAKLAEHAPQRALSYEKMGEVFLERGELTGAIRMLQTAVRINPKQIECYLHLARIHADMNAFAEAEAMAEAGVKIDPLYPDAFNLLAEVQDRALRAKASPRVEIVPEILPSDIDPPDEPISPVENPDEAPLKKLPPLEATVRVIDSPTLRYEVGSTIGGHFVSYFDPTAIQLAYLELSGYIDSVASDEPIAVPEFKIEQQGSKEHDSERDET